jgi:hypothetical protein
MTAHSQKAMRTSEAPCAGGAIAAPCFDGHAAVFDITEPAIKEAT